VIPALRYHGLGLIPWSPLAGGLLGGILKKAQQGHEPGPRAAWQLERCRPQVEAYENLCPKLGEEPAYIALAWLLHQPAVTAVITGPRTLDQFRQSLRASGIQLAPETLRELDEIWPGPGGEAPEAYAW